MKILIKRNDGPNIRLLIPSILILNRFGAGFAQRALNKHGLSITKTHARVFMQALNQYRREHPDWVLAEIQGHSGEEIRIEL